MAAKIIREVTLCELSPYAKTQQIEAANLYGELLVSELVKGMLYIVSHNPFYQAAPVPGRPGRYVIRTYTATSPVFLLTYTFRDGLDKREILKFDLRLVG